MKTNSFSEERIKDLAEICEGMSASETGDARYYWSGISSMLNAARGLLSNPYGCMGSVLGDHEYDLFDKGVINCQRFLKEELDFSGLRRIRLCTTPPVREHSSKYEYHGNPKTTLDPYSF